MSRPQIKRTPLYDRHLALGAKVVDFHGFAMPVQYSGIQQEHRHVRSSVGLFDISHMGEFEVWGIDAFDFVQMVTTNDVGQMMINQVQYTAFCYEHGGLVDDLTLYRFADHYLMVVNASNADKDFDWIQRYLSGDVQLRNRSDDFGLLALQGPLAAQVLAPMTGTDLSRIKFYWFVPGEVAGIPALISRTGYTGEDGFELYVEGAEDTVRLWDALMEQGAQAGIAPIGLGARDSLRLEMGYNLYGNDIWEETHPLEARMGFAVQFDQGDFVGREALRQKKTEGMSRRLVGLELEGKAFPRQGYPIRQGEREVGVVTSGTVSPSLGRPIAMGYVPLELSEIGTPLVVDCRGRPAAAVVARLPFYKEGSRK